MPQPLKTMAFSGARWTATSSVVNTVLQFVQIAVLARILSPDDFGLVGIVMIVVGFGQMFADAGISAAIIHRQEVTREQLSSLYWLNLAGGVAVCLLVIAATPLSARFFGRMELVPLFELGALSLVIVAVGQQFQTLLQRDLHFDRIASFEMISTFCGTVVAVVAALAGAAAASPIVGQLARAGVNSTLLAADGFRRFRPAWHFARRDLAGFLGFGLYQMGEKSVNYFNSRVDQLLIGRVLGTAPLGFYNLAYNLMIQPLSRINPVVTRVVFPLYARVQQDHARLRYGYLETRKYLALINFPLLLGLFAVARPFVRVIYGEQWEASIPIVELLCLVGLNWVVGNPAGSVLLARGRADIGFKWNLAQFVVTPLTLYTVLHSGAGLVSVCRALLVLNVVYLVASYFVMVRPMLGGCARAVFVDTFLVPLAYAGAMALIVRVVVVRLATSDLVALVAGVLCGALVYSATMLLFERARIRELRRGFFSAAGS